MRLRSTNWQFPSLKNRVQIRRLPMSIKFIASLAIAAAFCFAPSSANAGHLFGHRAAGCGGCDVAPSCGCEVAMPSCGCEIAPSCGCESACDPCAPRGGKLKGFFSRLHAMKSSCCAPAPVCCEPAPVCAPVCAPAPVYAPSCGCEVVADPCCDPCAKPGLFAKIKARLAAKCASSSCCDTAPSCGCEIAPSCGCGM